MVFLTASLRALFKNPAYGRHWISRSMRILGLLQFWRSCVIVIIISIKNKMGDMAALWLNRPSRAGSVKATVQHRALVCNVTLTHSWQLQELLTKVLFLPFAPAPRSPKSSTFCRHWEADAFLTTILQNRWGLVNGFSSREMRYNCTATGEIAKPGQFQK